MNNESYIRFVDTHPECDCGDNDLNFVLHPHLLKLTLIFVMQICMVKSCMKWSFIQIWTHFLTFFLTQTINNAWLISMILQNRTNLVDSASFRLLSYFIHQIGTVKAGLEKITIFKFQLFYDFLLNSLCHGSC